MNRSSVCIRRLIDSGADPAATDDAGKTPATMAEELKSIGAWSKALEESDRRPDGSVTQPWLTPVSLSLTISLEQVLG